MSVSTADWGAASVWGGLERAWDEVGSLLLGPRRSKDQVAFDAERARHDLRVLASSYRFVLMSGSLFEALRDLGVEEFVDSLPEALVDKAIQMATNTSGVDVDEELHATTLPTSTSTEIPEAVSMDELIDRVVALGRSIVGAAPSPEFEAYLRAHGLETEVYEVVRAAERLRFFVARNEPNADARLHTLGRAYANGRLSLDELAAATNTSRQDAIVLLEFHGYSRPVENLRLSPDRRAEIVARLNEQRQGDDAVNEAEAVRREVVASQRIEGVDARWLPTRTKTSS
ncbi:MAG: hypothetical protein RIT81_17820 [Deltaproteobacteria bacterium]